MLTETQEHQITRLTAERDVLQAKIKEIIAELKLIYSERDKLAIEKTAVEAAMIDATKLLQKATNDLEHSRGEIDGLRKRVEELEANHSH